MIKSQIKLFLKIVSIYIFKTTFFFIDAFKYETYLLRCKLKFKKKIHSLNNPNFRKAAKEFNNIGATFVDDKETQLIGKKVLDRLTKEEKRLKWEVIKEDNRINLKSDLFKSFPELRELCETILEPVINEIYKSNYKVLFGVMFKSFPFIKNPTGSQIWHSDGGPGTSINIIFYPKGASENQGAMKFISWKNSRKILIKCDQYIKNNFNIKKASKKEIRDAKADFYENEIKNDDDIHVFQPTSDNGSVLFFRNNCVHKGGYPKENNDRLAIILNVYPHIDKPNYSDWFTNGRQKSVNFPRNPNF